MESLERHRGHFYNWYDTQSLRPLLPLYVSSVDSGNLAGHLLILRQGLLALADDTLLGRRFLEGLQDTLAIAVEAAKAVPAAHSRLAELQQELEAAILSPPALLSTLRLHLTQWTTTATEVTAALEAGDTDSETPLLWWANALTRQCRNGLEELLFLAPWLDNAVFSSMAPKSYPISTKSPPCANWQP